MLRIWYSCLNPTLRSATNLAFAPVFLRTFGATNLVFVPEFLPSAVSRIWHSRLHTLRRSVHESCIRARISIFRRATNLAFAPAYPPDVPCTNPAFEPEFLSSAEPRIWHSRLRSPQVLPPSMPQPKDLTRDVTYYYLICTQIAENRN